MTSQQENEAQRQLIEYLERKIAQHEKIVSMHQGVLTQLRPMLDEAKREKVSE